jgi:thioredoxin 1
VTEKNGPLHVGDGDFEAHVLKAELPVLVDFWAPWCGPCRMVAPFVEEMAGQYAGRAVVAKVNTDEHQAWARKLGIRGIPTLIFFKGGVEVDRIIGAVPKKILEEKLDTLL